MKLISLIILMLVATGCSNLELATLYSPKELELQQSRKLEGLAYSQLKADPLESYAVIYTDNMTLRDLLIDENDVKITFSFHRKVVILPGKHKLTAKVKLSTEWKPFRSYMHGHGFTQLNNGDWVRPGKPPESFDFNVLDIINRGYFYYPVSISFTAEAGKIYLFRDLVYDVKFLNNKEFDSEKATGHFF